MNSGISGTTMARPGATMVAASIEWWLSSLPLAHTRVWQLRAADLLRAEVFGSVQGDQRAPPEALECPHPLTSAKRGDDLVEGRLQKRGMDRIQHRVWQLDLFRPSSKARR
jgi:hypothetical protein